MQLSERTLMPMSGRSGGGSSGCGASFGLDDLKVGTWREARNVVPEDHLSPAIAQLNRSGVAVALCVDESVGEEHFSSRSADGGGERLGMPHEAACSSDGDGSVGGVDKDRVVG